MPCASDPAPSVEWRPARVGRPPRGRTTSAGRLLATVVVASLCGLSATRAVGATCTWTGLGGDGLWSNSLNWAGFGCSTPGAADTAQFSVGSVACTVNVDPGVGAITINGYSGTITQSAALTVNGDFSQASGTFAGGSGTIHVGGTFSLSGGTFRATSGRLEVVGSFGKTGGTFTHNNGQLMLSASTSQTFASAGATFYDLTVNDGLAGYWPLDESSGSSLADKSGYANSGTLAGTYSRSVSPPTSINFSDARAVTFDGSSARASLGTTGLPAANAAQSISAWVRFAGASSTQSLVALTGSSSAVTLGLGSGNVRVLKNSGSLVSTTAPSTGTWHHVAYTWDGSTNTLYVDGVAAGTSSTAHDSSAVTAAFIGATSASAGFLNGSLDDVRIYSRALSASEVASLSSGYQAGTSRATQTLTGAPTIAHDLTIAAGTLAAGANGISVAGSWFNCGGMFSGTGTVTFTGSGTSNVIRSAGQAFGRLTISGSGTWAIDDALAVPSQPITISAGTLSNTSYTVRAGNINASGGTYTPGTGVVIADGSSDTTLGVTTVGGLRVEDPTETNLVGYWKLDAAQGVTFLDSSGNGNTGTLVNGPKWTSSVPATIHFADPAAVTLSGSSSTKDHGSATISSLNLNPNTTHITVGYWMYYSSVPTTSQDTIVLKSGGGLLQIGFLHNGSFCSTSDCLAAWNSGGGATPLVYTTTPPASGWHHIAYSWDGTKSRLYVDGSVTQTTTSAPTSSTLTTLYLGTYDGTNELFNGRLDDVRIYNTALSDTQVQALAAGRYANTGGAAILTLGGSSSADGIFAVDSGDMNLSSFAFTAASGDATKEAYVYQGTLTAGTGTATFKGGLNVGDAGTLVLASTGTIAIGNGKSLVVDGTLQALDASTIPTIQVDGSGSYAFSVGSSSTARPTLNINGLAVRNTDANGMFINTVSGSSTTFTRFDSVAFSNGTGTRLLQIYATSLFLTSSGCSFDAGAATGTTTYAVTLAGNGFNGTPDTAETRAMFGRTTCADSWTVGSSDRICLNTAQGGGSPAKSDDDADGDGVGNTPASNGAVVQFVRAAETDTAGTIIGFPTAAFDWNTFTYYSTYAAYNTASGTSGIVYVRDGTGAAQYAWTAPSGETIVGTPRWITRGSTHYLYVPLSSGKIYRLVDDPVARTLTVDTGWTTNPFDCGCTIMTPLGMDSSNLYWGGTQSGAQKLWTLGQVSETQPVGSPQTITPAITSTAPALWTNGGATYLFFGLTGHIVKLDVTNQVLDADNSNPGSASVWGRILVGASTASRVFAGDDGGKVWAIDPSGFAGTSKVWSYSVSGDMIKSSGYYDYATNTVHYGTEAGKVLALSSAGAALTGYPYTPGSTSDAIRSALLYRSGVLVVGTTTGRLFFIDRQTGSGASLIRQYYFGATESVSGVGFDPNTNRYMVSTSDSTTKDGRLYYVDVIADPTPSSS